MPALQPGLYDLLINEGLAEQLSELPETLKSLAAVERESSHAVLARALQTRIFHALKAIGGDDRVQRQVELANTVLELLAVDPNSGAQAEDRIPSKPERLLALLEPATSPAQPRQPARPRIPLASSDLLVNARHDLSLGPELKREMESADRVDLLCSFVKWSGLRLVEGPLEALLRRRPQVVRVLTTTYMGATERRALDRLRELGAQVRVSYDKGRTRLHAKAWLFHRESGFSTAYVGSSNLSAAAVLDGLEWNVRLSQIDNPAILSKFSAAFGQYWADPEFRPYDPVEFDEAIRSQRRSSVAHLLKFELQPRPHQRQILEELEAERAYGHMRNLVVAATGTGKTIVAALDYKRLHRVLPSSKLLFVAHRREILRQSRSTFQVALGDGAFGELLADGQKPVEWNHVFANIQSLSEARLAKFPPDAFDVVIIDEFHHAAARSYTRLLDHLEPKILLGLTATPERADGQSVLGWFDDRIASETRLWTALDQGLLCPFQYFGIGNGPDLRGVKWSGGKYDTRQLSNVYTADHMFALRVLQETRAKVRDIQEMRALGFCVDLNHARFMTERFNEAGIQARMLSGSSSAAERDQGLRELGKGELQIVFTVDLFNEGVDIPQVDTILFLRPTESPTIFLQQLGRGLRLDPGKECCTVLDFIGHPTRQFRFDARYRAIIGGTRRQIERSVDAGFPSLPSGCFIALDKQARELVLANVRAALGAGRRVLVQDLRELARDGHEPTLREFVRETGVELEDIYANTNWSWTELRRRAGILEPALPTGTKKFERAFSRMLHLDDVRLEYFRAFLGHASPPRADPDDPYQRLLFVLTGHFGEPYTAMASVWSLLWTHAYLRRELLELLELLQDRLRGAPRPLPGRHAPLPLRVHGTYSRDEVFAAFNQRNTKGGLKRTQGGVYDARAWKTELLFVELEKSEKDYTPTTLYNDYPVSSELFHWESQASCHEKTPAGKRYLSATPNSDQDVLLFVRQQRKDSRGLTSPYLLLGLCDIAEHRGARPMQIDWHLRTPMPAWFFQETKVAGG